MLSKRVRGMKLPKDTVECIRAWLNYELGFPGRGDMVCPFTLSSNQVCPFSKHRPTGCSICKNIFPSLKTDDYYGACTCPCHTLTPDYVRDVAQRLVRNYTEAENLKNIIKVTRRLAKEYKIKLGVKR